MNTLGITIFLLLSIGNFIYGRTRDDSGDRGIYFLIAGICLAIAIGGMLGYY